jgi:hypothetical protein
MRLWLLVVCPIILVGVLWFAFARIQPGRKGKRS